MCFPSLLGILARGCPFAQTLQVVFCPRAQVGAAATQALVPGDTSAAQAHLTALPS